MKFTPIDLSTWSGGQMFYYFSKMAPTGYSITTNMDVTALMNTLKSKKLKLFPTYLWLVTKNLNQQMEFKIAEKEGVIGYYDTLTPLYASFHQDDKTISFMWSHWNENYAEFYNSYIENRRLYGDNRGLLCQTQTPPPENAYTVSCVPWISFEHFSVHSYENKPYYFPSVESGKLFKTDGRTLMPLSLTCHHATTFGYHLKIFLDSLQADMDNFHEFIPR